MAYDGIRITAPVTMTDIHNCFGVTGDLGASYQSAIFKIYSKNKPLNIVRTSPVDDTIRKSNYYGIANIPEYRYIATMFADVLNGNYANADIVHNEQTASGMLGLAWCHDKPSGVGLKYRMLDCNGYFRDAIPPIGTAYQASYDFLGSVTIGFNCATGTVTGQLYLSNMQIGVGQLANYYPTILMWTSASDYVIMSAKTAAGSSGTFMTVADIEAGNGLAFRFNQAAISGKTWNAIVFLSPDAIDYRTSMLSTIGNYFPLFVSQSVFSVVIQSINITMLATSRRDDLLMPIYCSYSFTTTDDRVTYTYGNVRYEFLDAGNNVLYTGTAETSGSITSSSPRIVSDAVFATSQIVAHYDLHLATAVRIRATFTGNGNSREVICTAIIITGEPPRD